MAVILARGPAGVTRALRWNLKTDELEEGRPIRARVYERKCDLSSDGRWLIYAAYGKGPDLPFHGDGYTVLCRPPSLSAELFIPMGTTYFGGGVFCKNGALSPRLSLREPERAALGNLGVDLREWPPLEAPPPAERERTFDNIHWRLIRDGWEVDGNTYVRALPCGLKLVKSIERLTETHHLLDREGTPILEATSWEWADSYEDEILFTEKGSLYRMKTGEEPRLIATIRAATINPQESDVG